MPNKQGLTPSAGSAANGDGSVPVFAPAKPVDPAWLGAMFGMEPKEAVAFLDKKGLAVSGHWAEMLDEAHARAFTVAHCARVDVLQDIRSGVLDALKNGKTLKQFQSELEPLLKEKGWWGTQKMVDQDGKERLVQLGNPRRLKTIYQTNLQTAYMAGRMKAQMAAPSCLYLAYVAVMDGRTRPSHRALNGRVYPKDDPIWSSIYPPNGFNCRCRTRGLTERQAGREGAKIEDSAEHTVTRTIDVGPDKITGEIFPTTQTGVRVTLEDGRPGVMWTDPGFNSNPLASHIFDKQLEKKAFAALEDGPKAFQLVQNIVLSLTRIKAWNSFLDNTVKYGRRQGQTMTVGIIPFDHAREFGVNPIVSVEDRLIIGPKARRHTLAGDVLSIEEWKSLPGRLANAQWYRDERNGNLVAIMSDGSFVAVEKDGTVATAYKDAAMDDKIKQGIIKKLGP